MRIDAILLAALVAALALGAFAQAAPTDAEKKAAAAKKDATPAPAKDAQAPPKDTKSPPKAAPKAPPKAPPKADPKKTDPKKAPPAKDAKKGGTQQVNPNVTIYRDAKDMPVARDKQGNVIPTSPDAYDVSSATKK